MHGTSSLQPASVKYQSRFNHASTLESPVLRCHPLLLPGHFVQI